MYHNLNHQMRHIVLYTMRSQFKFASNITKMPIRNLRYRGYQYSLLTFQPKSGLQRPFLRALSCCHPRPPPISKINRLRNPCIYSWINLYFINNLDHETDFDMRLTLIMQRLLTKDGADGRTLVAILVGRLMFSMHVQMRNAIIRLGYLRLIPLLH